MYLTKFRHGGITEIEVMTDFVVHNSSKAPHRGEILVSRRKCSTTGLSMLQEPNRKYF